MTLKVLALLASTVLIAAPAAAQTVRANNPDTIVQALQSAGYTARLGTDEFGDPQVESASSGSNFTVFFFDCTEHRNCGAIQFHASYEMSPPTVERMNEWNRMKRYARGFIATNNYPSLEMDINVDPDGISRGLFVANLELWASLMADFEDHIGWE